MTIEQQTEIIEQLMSSYPVYHSELGRWSPENRAFELHDVKVRDAFWQRRMLIAELEGLDLEETAKVF